MLTDPPRVDFFKRVVIPLLVVLGVFTLAVVMTRAESVQTSQACEHDQAKIAYWENYQILPGRVRAVDGHEVIMSVADKKQVKVLTLNWDKTTDPSRPPTQGKDYMFGYCRVCHHIFIYRPL